MHAFTVTRLIHAPLADVWAVAGDPTRFPEWMRGLDAVEPPEEGGLEPGAELTVTVSDRGQQRRASLTLARWEPPRTFAIRAGGASAGTIYRYDFEPARDGAATRARLEAEVTVAGKWVLLAWLLKRGMKRADGGQLKALGRLVTGR
ncbi:SRPBCC family protein [Marivibrio halodurans]|uniref:SRPBCC family protein n=1 Tax=Marivibrio halodurans TaxID=2039722 RepID=A0A8J7V2G0_9PROT|nr:SRPBCC family protein [Marivibrio halodurans]MBP5858796.1 SRPBCC family protein [Marivibrio halodurans]